MIIACSDEKRFIFVDNTNLEEKKQGANLMNYKKKIILWFNRKKAIERLEILGIFVCATEEKKILVVILPLVLYICALVSSNQLL